MNRRSWTGLLLLGASLAAGSALTGCRRSTGIKYPTPVPVAAEKASFSYIDGGKDRRSGLYAITEVANREAYGPALLFDWAASPDGIKRASRANVVLRKPVAGSPVTLVGKLPDKLKVGGHPAACTTYDSFQAHDVRVLGRQITVYTLFARWAGEVKKKPGPRSVYFLVKLPALKPGWHKAVVGFTDATSSGSGVIVPPRYKSFPPTFAPMTCEFEVLPAPGEARAFRAKPGLTCKVVDVRCGFTVAISRGGDSGIVEGDIFEIRREGRKLGRARASTVWDDFAGLRPLDRMRWKPGDDAVLVQLAPKDVTGNAPETKRAHAAGWRDKQAAFDFKIRKGRRRGHFEATITIRNLTDKPLSFPTPMLMPAAGDTNKNNIRVYNWDGWDGKKLGMVGAHEHRDFASRPVTEIPSKASRSWSFQLKKYWPQMASPGTYAVEFWYFANDNDKLATWKGRVKMPRLLIKSGK